jgi:hypothetical protein
LVLGGWLAGLRSCSAGDRPLPSTAAYLGATPTHGNRRCAVLWVGACNNQKELLTPFELLMNDLSTLTTKHPNKEIVIGGDFNVNFANKSHAKHQRMLL